MKYAAPLSVESLRYESTELNVKEVKNAPSRVKEKKYLGQYLAPPLGREERYDCRRA
jgi:hypothetical protein